MKKIIQIMKDNREILIPAAIFVTVSIILTIFACHIIKNAVDKLTPQQPGSFFSDDRYVLLDKGKVMGYDAYVYADTVTGVIYEHHNGGTTPVYNSDGSLVLYDPY